MRSYLVCKLQVVEGVEGESCLGCCNILLVGEGVEGVSLRWLNCSILVAVVVVVVEMEAVGTHTPLVVGCSLLRCKT